MADIS